MQQGRRFMSFSVCNTLLYLFNQSVVAGALLFVMACCVGKWQKKTMKETSYREAEDGAEGEVRSQLYPNVGKTSQALRD